VGRDHLDAALSVTTVAAGRLDVGECSELEIGEGLESLGSGGVAQAVGQPSKPHLAYSACSASSSATASRQR
jgi:hypothetical protein